VKILLIEDDVETADYIAQGLTEEGHVLRSFADGRDGLFSIKGEEWDLVIVDRMVPGMDGLNVVKALRCAKVKTPVLFLTALGGVGDRVNGLNAGGDDYLVKPFAFAELVARVNALGRRSHTIAAETVLRVGDLEMNLLNRAVTRNTVPIPLQPREFRLLEYLMRHAGKIVTRTMLLEHVWDFHFDPKTSVVETHISRLRAKLNRDEAPELIHTMRGAGYSLHAPS